LQHTISLYLRGHEDRKAGGTIEIDWPSIKEDGKNPGLNGKYFVKSVVHYFYKEQAPYYNQKLILCKNAYEKKY